MKVLIVGGGTTLFFLCRTFAARGYEVVVINRDREECVQLARELSATVVCGDGSDAAVLKDAGAMAADAVLAITPNDEDNLVTCQLAALKFGVPRAVALANDPDNAEVFEKLGVSSFSTTRSVSSLIEQRASLEQITNLLPVGEGRVNVTEVVLDDALWRLDGPAQGEVAHERPEVDLARGIENGPVLAIQAGFLLPLVRRGQRKRRLPGLAGIRARRWPPEELQGATKVHTFRLPQQVDHVAASVAGAKAIPRLGIGPDVEARLAVLVERTQPHPALAHAAQGGDIASRQLLEADCRLQAVDLLSGQRAVARSCRTHFSPYLSPKPG